MKTYFLFASLLIVTAGCADRPAAPPAPKGEPSRAPEATALDGRPLYPQSLPEATRQLYDSLLAVARAVYEADSADLAHLIWLGRRTAYLGRYREAIDLFTRGIARFPDAPELYRHRGHRYISTRRFDAAIADFERAAELAKERPLEVEPDGLPNRLNIPLSNLHFNIYYHWALAHYLKGDFQKAAGLYERCLDYSVNPDLLAATADWLYMTYRRLGETQKAEQLLARISPDMEIIENDAYFQRLLLYKGLKQPGELLDLDAPPADPDQLLNLVTQGYGVGNWYLYNGQPERAREIFRQIVATEYWSAFGYIAAEMEGANE
jgi:tetratricopeptide (TPR) repeat protein